MSDKMRSLWSCFNLTKNNPHVRENEWLPMGWYYVQWTSPGCIWLETSEPQGQTPHFWSPRSHSDTNTTWRDLTHQGRCYRGELLCLKIQSNSWCKANSKHLSRAHTSSKWSPATICPHSGFLRGALVLTNSHKIVSSWKFFFSPSSQSR